MLRLPLIRYVVRALFFVLACVLAYFGLIEVFRHRALLQLQSHSNIANVKYTSRIRIPTAIAALLPVVQLDEWFVDVSEISLHYPPAPADLLSLAAQFPETQLMTIDVYDVDPPFLKLLGKIRGLTHLRIRSSSILGGWEELACLRKLETLRVRCNSIDSLKGMNRITSLTHLSLVATGRLNGDLSHLSGLRLHRLNVDVYGVESLRGMQALTHLTSLELNACEFNGMQLSEFLPLSLEHVHLDSSPRAIEDSLLVGLDMLPNLRELSVKGHSISEAGIESLLKLHPLRSLEVVIDTWKARSVWWKPDDMPPTVRSLLDRPDARVVYKSTEK